MATIAEAMAMASIVVGLVSIPAASQGINSSANVSDTLTNISASEELPESESTQVTANRFIHTASNAYQEFTEEISSGSTNVSLETPESRLSVQKKPSATVYTLTSPSGELRIEKSPSGVKETVETPSGTLVRETVNGAVHESFSGTNRQQVEQTARELRELMEEKRSRVEEFNRENQEQFEPRIKIEVQPEEDEYVELTNSDSREVDLKGWTLEDAADNAYTFPAVTLSPGETLRLYTGDGEDTGSTLYWGTSNVWNNKGDTATLYDSSGEEIAEESY